MSFHLGQGPRSVEWQPLASASRRQLLLAPGYVMDEIPELPTGGGVNNLLIRTRPRERPGLETLIWIDQDLLYDFTSRGLGVDLFELAQSLDQEGERLIITCSCGHAGCAGIHRGVDVYHGDGTVYWVIYEPAPARTVVFDEQAYRQAVEMGLAEFRQLGAEHPLSFLDRLQLHRLAGIESPPGKS